MARNLFRMIAVLKNLPRPVVVVIIIAATFLVYAGAIRNGFVWDDTALVLRDPLIRSWTLIPEGFRHFLFLDATASNFYRPMQRLTFVADYQLYGFSRPWGWHLTSVVIHAAAAVALFFLVKEIFKKIRGDEVSETGGDDRWALSAALLWDIHPLHTSAITYVSGRADPLAALFAFSGLTLGLMSLRSQARRWSFTFGAAACFLGAMLSKESGAMALVIWLVFLAWSRPSRMLAVRWIGIIACIVGVYCGLRFTSEKTPPPASTLVTPVNVRPILAARAWVEYAGLFAAPVNLHMERDVATHSREDVAATLYHARLREYETLGGLALFGGFLCWWRRAFRKDSTVALCLTAFFVAYLPISDLFSLNASMAEHWLYVPSAFLLTALLLTVRDWLPRVGQGIRVAIVGVACVWMCLLGARTAWQQQYWRDQRAFIEHTIASGGDSPRMRMNLANLYSGEGRNDLALAEYQNAVERAPDSAIIWLGYASVLLRAHNYDGARDALEKTKSSTFLAPERLQTQAVLEHLQSGTDSGNLLYEAMNLAPKNWPLRKRYTEYIAEKDGAEAGLRGLREFVQAYPFRGESWKLIGSLMEQGNRPDLAMIAYQEAADRDVRDQESRDAIRRLAAKP